MGRTFRRNDRFKKDRRDRNFKKSKKFKEFKQGEFLPPKSNITIDEPPVDEPDDVS